MSDPTPAGAMTSPRQAPAPRAAAPRVAVVGIHGYGASHVINALTLQAQGRARLVGLVDPVPGPIERDGVRLGLDELPPIHPSIDSLIAEAEVDVVAIATPLHTHAELAITALKAGADVLLEKPPVTDLTDFARVGEAQRATGGLIQVGFQSLGSHALGALTAAIDNGHLGRIVSIGAVGSWTRDRGYWTRARWAGRRSLDGVAVVDGAVANPFAHAVMTALRIAGWSTPGSVREVQCDLRRVNPIEADDTSSVRILSSEFEKARFAGAITCAFTLAGPDEDDPFILVRGTAGSARLEYTTDRLSFDGGGSAAYGRDDLLGNLLDARAGRAELISPFEFTGAFVRVIDGVAAAPVREIDQRFVTWQGSGLAARPVLRDAPCTMLRAAGEGRLFRELDDLPWRD